MKENTKKIDQLAEELITLRNLSTAAHNERAGLSDKIRQYQTELANVDQVKCDLSLSTQEILDQRNQKKERLKKLISDSESTTGILNNKINDICNRIMQVKPKLSEARAKYFADFQAKLLSDQVFIKSLKLIASCVDAGYIVNEGYFNQDIFIESLFENLPDENSNIKDEVRADVVLGLGRY